MNENQFDMRTALIWLARLAALLILLLALRWFWNFYHTGKIIITTSNPHNTITLNQINNESGQSIREIRSVQGSLSSNLKVGHYSVTVGGVSMSTTQTFTLKPRQTLRYTINPIKPTGVEPVAYENAQDLEATPNQLVYLDNSTSTLAKIDNQNNISNIASNYHFQSIEWADPSFEVGQTTDGRLYVVSNGVVSRLKVPFSYGNQRVGFDVAPNREIYVSSGADVYAGNKTGDFKKIYTANAPRPTIAASDDFVAVSEPVTGANPSGASKPLLAIVKNNGKTNKKKVEAERLSWSPNGQYLAAVNDSSPVIYDQGLHTVNVVPTKSSITQFMWFDNSTLLYAVSDQFWTYNLPASKSQLFSNMPFTDSVKGIYMSSDKTYVYVTTYNSFSGTFAIKRIGLKGQVVPDYVYKLQDVLPQKMDKYLITLVNFAPPPTVLVKPFPNTPGNYVGPAEGYLQGLGFNIGQLRIVQGQPVADH